MTSIFESPFFDMLRLPFREVDGFADLFGDATPTKHAGFSYLNSLTNGISFSLDRKKRIDTVFLYGGGFEKFDRFTGDLPGGLTFDTSRGDVRRLHGEPHQVGEIGGVGIMHNDTAFDTYTSEVHYVRITYNPSESAIHLITLAPN